MINISLFSGLRSRRGFSAVEVIAAATIIAILALILIPTLTRQVEKGRNNGALDELSQFAKVIPIAYAENNNHYFRLQDYDNLQTYNVSVSDPTTEVPVTYWGLVGPMLTTERARLKTSWDGPYTTFHKFQLINDLLVSAPNAFTIIQPQSGTITQPGGPIFVMLEGNFTPGSAIPQPPTQDERRDLYPVDPWGNPYIFFGVGTINVPGVAQESFYTPVIYSMGPDGNPGGLTNPAAKDYYPSAGSLGNGDDVTWKF